MRSYGLITSGGGKDSKLLHVTSLGQAITLEPDGSDAWFGSLREAALSDTATQSIYGLWGANLPSEGGIKIKLEKDMNYSPDGAKRFANVITDNYAYAHVIEESSESADETGAQETDQQEGLPLNEPERKESKSSSQIRKTNLLLPGVGREIVILAPPDLNDKEFDLILKWLELQKYGLVVTPAKKESPDGQKEEADIPF
jgi:hypothetical protein